MLCELVSKFPPNCGVESPLTSADTDESIKSTVFADVLTLHKVILSEPS